MQTLLRTPLYDRHVALGARLVPFAGWEMPVQYEGVIPEHLVPAGAGGELWDSVLERGALPCGLGARDTLRLEVCYPLHGNDIGPDTDAISAGLGWVCALDKDFTGVEELRRIKAEGPEQRLAAFVMEEPGIPRQGMTILDGGAGVGTITSGSHSPMLERGIGLGYVAAGLAERVS